MEKIIDIYTTNIFLTYYIFSSLIIGFICITTLFTYFQNKFKIISSDQKRMDIMVSIFLGILMGILNVIGIFMIFFISEKFKYGIGLHKNINLKCQHCNKQLRLSKAIQFKCEDSSYTISSFYLLYITDKNLYFHIFCTKCYTANYFKFPDYIPKEQHERYMKNWINKNT